MAPIRLLCTFECLWLLMFTSIGLAIQTAQLRHRRATTNKPWNVFGSCGGTHSRSFGSLASPNFPSKYPTMSNCTWKISVPRGYIIKFDFLYMDMEDGPRQKGGDCGADSLSIFDGLEKKAKLVGEQKYCGYDTPFNDVYSTSNIVRVLFLSDSSLEYDGFVISWEAVKPKQVEFNCNFEIGNGLCPGWSQSINDDFDWTGMKGPTPSGRRNVTGPKTDHTLKSSDGTYFYIEASGKKQDQRAVLYSPQVQLTGTNGNCFQFWYFMKGDGMGSLLVYQVNDDHILLERNLLYNITGEQDHVWNLAQLTLIKSNKALQLAFVGVRGGNYKSDIAIDDVRMSSKRCVTIIPTTTLPITTTTTTTQKPTTTVTSTTQAPTTTTTFRPTTRHLFTPPVTTPEPCKNNMYRCRVSNNCIPLSWFCDGTQDCLQNEDEEGCTSSCSWNSWSSWSECSQSCGGGSRKQKRTCLKEGKECSTCEGHAISEEACNTYLCASWTTWESWSACSVTCNGGRQSRTRQCVKDPARTDVCVGPTIQIINCNGQNCPSWSRWTAWSNCPVTCGEGKLARRRVCTGGEVGQSGCMGNMVEEKPCFDGNFSQSCVKVTQGSCLPSSQCSSFNCDTMQRMLNFTDISSCVASCCKEELCNEPTTEDVSPANFINACILDPCLNGGSCSSSSADDYVCTCRSGYSGKNCQQESSLTCFSGTTTQFTPTTSTATMLPSSCTSGQDVCQTTSVVAEIAGQKIYMNIAQCSSRLVCTQATCEAIVKTLPASSVKSCDVACCTTDYCNTAKNQSETSTSSSTLLPPTTITPVVVQDCPKRSLALARSRGRVCPDACSNNAQCSEGLVCQCDGPCGKTCSAKDLTCPSNILQLPGLSVKCTRRNLVGSKCTFSCSGSAKLVGFPNFNCQSTGRWDKRRTPTCQTTTVSCPKRNLALAQSRGRVCPDACSNNAQCSEGLVCQCDGPCGKTCSAKDLTCPSNILQLPGLSVKCTKINFVGSKCTFSCSGSAKLVGFPNFNCQSTGRWDKQRTPTCQTTTVKCPKRNLLLARQRGRKCPASCRSSRQCDGNQSCQCDGPCGRTCSAPDTKCPSSLVKPVSSSVRVRCTRGTFVGSKCTFSCVGNSKMDGLPNLNCQSNGAWDKRSAPVCRGRTASTSVNGVKGCVKRRALHDGCCRAISYNSKLKICCNGVIRAKRPNASSCCGTIPYNSSVRKCCNHRLVNEQSQFCCGNKVYSIGRSQSCCNNNLFNPTTHRCDPRFGGRVLPLISDVIEEEEE